MMSNVRIIKKVANDPQESASLMLLHRFDIFCDFLSFFFGQTHENMESKSYLKITLVVKTPFHRRSIEDGRSK